MIRTSDFELYYSAMGKFGDLATGVQMLYAMQDALGILLTEVQVNVPVDTGALAQDANEKILDYSPGKIVQGGVSMMKDGEQKPYAWQREKGGVIVPKPENPTGRLWWVDSSSGRLVSAKFVVQSGSFYMENSLDNKANDIVEKLKGGILESASIAFD